MNPRKQIGSAVWLLVFFKQYMPEGWDVNEPAYVANANIMSDSFIAQRLFTSERTIAIWRGRLRKAGVLDWLVKFGEGRVYIVRGLERTIASNQDCTIQQTQKAQNGTIKSQNEVRVNSDSTPAQISKWQN